MIFCYFLNLTNYLFLKITEHWRPWDFVKYLLFENLLNMVRIRNYCEVGSGSGSTTMDLNPPGIPAHVSGGQAADCSSCRRQRLPASCQTRSPAQHRTRASADQRRTCTKKELLKTASCQTSSPAQHRTRASADQRRTCGKPRERYNYGKLCSGLVTF